MLVLLLLTDGVWVKGEGWINAGSMGIGRLRGMGGKLSILIGRGGPVGLALVHKGRGYLGVLLGRVVGVVPGLGGRVVGHQGGMLLELAVPRLGIVLVNLLVDVGRVGRVGVQRQLLFGGHVSRRHR